MSPENRLVRAFRSATSSLKKAWTLHVRLLRTNVVYEAVVIALTELFLQQRINLHRLVTTLVWLVSSRWPRPFTD